MQRMLAKRLSNRPRKRRPMVLRNVVTNEVWTGPIKAMLKTIAYRVRTEGGSVTRRKTVLGGEYWVLCFPLEMDLADRVRDYF